MQEYESKSKAPSKKDWEAALLEKIHNALNSGMTGEEALGVLTERQYDFLVDRDIDLDNLILTEKQQQNIKSLLQKGVGRPTFPNGYDKKYPPEKREFFEKICEFIVAEGGEIRPRSKCNYRNIEFDLDGKYYEIVFSCPPKKQGQ